MKQKLLCTVFWCLPGVVFCQDKTARGIKWAEGLTWHQIQKKAKNENKYIFVDCYATWCAPCKRMDKDVYSVDSVGNYLSAEFISVKVQMDQTMNDDAFVKSWYKTASYLGKEYNLSAYPTLLFFTPKGEMAAKEVGYKSADAFISIARNAKDPSKQYYILRKKYLRGKKDYVHMPFLFNTALQLHDTAVYRPVRIDYYAYLRSLPKDKLYTQSNIEFIENSMSRSDQVVFSMFYPDGSEVNKVMQNERYSQKVVDKMIMKEKVVPFLEASNGANEPAWDVLQQSIASDYNGDYAGRNLLDAKMQWYSNHNDGLKYARSFNDKMEKYGSDTTNLSDDASLNGTAYLIWLNLGKTSKLNKEIITELNRVCGWMEGVARRGEKVTKEYANRWDMYIDTYANLLHKVGRTSEAIKWEEFAILKLKETVDDEETIKSFSKGYENFLSKMKRGEPTWPIESK